MVEIIPNWHPAFVHFPIAFSTASVFFFLTTNLFKEKPWAAQYLITGRWMLWAAAISACIAAVFGWYAYNNVDHDDSGHLAMTLHAYWALAALGALVLLAAWDFRAPRHAAVSSFGFLIPLVAGWLLVVNAAWHGGEVVFRHGLGVMSLPKSEGAGHIHEQGEDHMPNHSDDTSHENDHVHDDTVEGEHPHDTEPVGTSPVANGASTVPKAGHTHAPGIPPHHD